MPVKQILALIGLFILFDIGLFGCWNGMKLFRKNIIISIMLIILGLGIMIPFIVFATTITAITTSLIGI